MALGYVSEFWREQTPSSWPEGLLLSLSLSEQDALLLGIRTTGASLCWNLASAALGLAGCWPQRGCSVSFPASDSAGLGLSLGITFSVPLLAEDLPAHSGTVQPP